MHQAGLILALLAPAAQDAPAERAGAASAVIDEKVYLLGGGDETGWATPRADRFDPSSGEWKALEPREPARVFAAAAVVEERIYLAGGFGKERSCLDAFQSYDPQQGAWEDLPPLPTPRNRLAAAAMAGRVYVTGGMACGEDGGERNTTAVEVFHTGKGKWSRFPDLITARHGHAAVEVGGKILVIGGYGDDGPNQAMLTTVEEFDPATGEWRMRASMKQARGFFGAAVMDGKVIVVGGRIPEATTEIYDPLEDRWTAGAPIPEERNRFSLGAVDGRLFVIGGDGKRASGAPPVLSYLPAEDRWLR